MCAGREDGRGWERTQEDVRGRKRMGEDGRGWERMGCKASGGRHVVVPPAGEWFDMALSFLFCQFYSFLWFYPFFSASFILSAISIAMRASPGMR